MTAEAAVIMVAGAQPSGTRAWAEGEAHRTFEASLSSNPFLLPNPLYQTLYNLLKQCHQLETKHLNTYFYGDISSLNHYSWHMT